MSWSPLVSVSTLVVFSVVWAALVGYGFYGGIKRSAGTGIPDGKQKSSSARRGAWLALVRRILLGGVLAFALAGPAVSVEREDITTNVEIYLAVDRTGSMAAEDIDGKPRLDLVRRNIEDLLDAAPGARYSILTWDGGPRKELPLTTDTSAVMSFAELLHQEISEFSAGSSLNRPVEMITEDMTNSAELRPENRRYLVVISDGESTDPDYEGVDEAWSEVASFIDGGVVWGYGTAAGGPMKIYEGGTGPTNEYIPDPDDYTKHALSMMDEESLKSVADMLGVNLVVNPSESSVSQLGAEFMKGAESQNVESRLNTSLNYIIWPFGIAAAMLIGWESISFTNRTLTWRRRHAV